MMYQLYEQYQGKAKWNSCGLFPSTKEAKEYAKEHCNPYSKTRVTPYRPDKSKNALEVKHLLEEKQGKDYER